MDQIIPSLAELLDHFSICFRHEAFHNFKPFVEAWMVCEPSHELRTPS